MIIIPAIYEGGRDLVDKSRKLSFRTGEITPEKVSELHTVIQQYVYLAIKAEPFMKEELDLINSLKSNFDDTGKTKSQRLRGAFYRLWEKKNEGYKDFNLYYDYKMDIIINHIKKQIDAETH